MTYVFKGFDEKSFSVKLDDPQAEIAIIKN